MILPVSPDAPAVIRFGAAAILTLHIGGAAVGLVSGAGAMVLRKGGRLHRLSGTVFFVAMLAMAGVGAAVSPFMPTQQAPNTIAGVFTLYLVASGWMTVRRRPGEIGRFEVGAFLVGLAVATGAVAFAWVSTQTPHDPHDPPGQVFFVFGTVAALAAAFDFRVIRSGGLAGAARITRHLWRMSVALLIAAGSFAGQPKAIPHFLRGSPIVLAPMLAVLAALIHWLIRMRMRPALRPAPAAA